MNTDLQLCGDGTVVSHTCMEMAKGGCRLGYSEVKLSIEGVGVGDGGFEV